MLLDKTADPRECEWYLRQTIQFGWSRNVLVHQIESRRYERQGMALTNFDRLLPAPQSDLARQVLKDPYTFDFLTLGPDAHERDLERGLLDYIRGFLLELGGQDYYLDLLFYHLKLRAFVVDLKTGEFEPEHAGKMGFYLQAFDDLLRHPTDQPSIGIILCKTKNEVIVEYSLKSVDRPVGVSSYTLAASLPEPLEGNLPTIEQPIQLIKSV